MLVLHGSLYIPVAHRSHDCSQIPGPRQNSRAVVMPSTIEHQILSETGLPAAWRNKGPIPARCPDLERLDGNTQPSFLVSQRSRSRSKTRLLIGTSLLPSAVLLSGTKITRFSQSRFSMRIRY